MDVGQDRLGGPHRCELLEDAGVAGLPGPVLAEEDGEPGVEGDALTRGQRIDALDSLQRVDREARCFGTGGLVQDDLRLVSRVALGQPLLDQVSLVGRIEDGLSDWLSREEYLTSKATRPSILLVRPVHEELAGGGRQRISVLGHDHSRVGGLLVHAEISAGPEC